MKSLIVVFGALLLIFAAPFVFQNIRSAVTEEYTQSIAGVTTGAGEYAENVTICRTVYNDETTSFLTITSNVSSDSPTAATYNSVSRALEISGLTADETRTLTAEFLIDTTVLPDGAPEFLLLLRWFYVFTIIGMEGGAIYAFFD